MMNNITKAILLAAGSLLLFSCQKVIKVDLNTADPRIVIEGGVSDEPGPYYVKVTRTVNFDQTNTFPPVAGAVVKLSDDAGNAETLMEVAPGIYQTTSISGIPGRTYTLSVTAESKTYTAVSKMPGAVAIDSLNVQKGYFTSVKQVHVFFSDPVGIKNWYRCIKTVNDTTYNDLFVTEDILRDGQHMEEILFTNEVEDSLTRGDSVTIALQSIDEGAYEYFRTLASITQGGDPGTAPANPKSNFNNGALGYFNTNTVRRQYIIVK